MSSCTRRWTFMVSERLEKVYLWLSYLRPECVIIERTECSMSVLWNFWSQLSCRLNRGRDYELLGWAKSWIGVDEQLHQAVKPVTWQTVWWSRNQKKSSSGLVMLNLMSPQFHTKKQTECRSFFLDQSSKVDSDNRMRCDLMSKNSYPKNKTERLPFVFSTLFESR